MVVVGNPNVRGFRPPSATNGYPIWGNRKFTIGYPIWLTVTPRRAPIVSGQTRNLLREEVVGRTARAT